MSPEQLRDVFIKPYIRTFCNFKFSLKKSIVNIIKSHSFIYVFDIGHIRWSSFLCKVYRIFFIVKNIAFASHSTRTFFRTHVRQQTTCSPLFIEAYFKFINLMPKRVCSNKKNTYQTLFLHIVNMDIVRAHRTYFSICSGYYKAINSKRVGDRIWWR